MMVRRSSRAPDRRIGDGVCEIDFVDPQEVAAARRRLPSARQLRSTADAFKALGNPSRLQILIALDDRELCVCDIAELLGVSMSGASQQLRMLRNLDAVDYRTDGKLAYYTLADPFWLGLAEAMIEKLEVRPKTPGFDTENPAAIA